MIRRRDPSLTDQGFLPLIARKWEMKNVSLIQSSLPAGFVSGFFPHGLWQLPSSLACRSCRPYTLSSSSSVAVQAAPAAAAADTYVCRSHEKRGGGGGCLPVAAVILLAGQ